MTSEFTSLYYIFTSETTEHTIMFVTSGVVTHNEILKIYRIIQYFKNIFKRNMVKNIFEV